jgi:dihydrofolate reductase
MRAPDLDAWISEQLASPHVMLMGSNTYRLMSEIVATGDDPTFPRMAELPKVVFSKSLHPPMSWVNTTVISDDLEVAMPAMKAEPGPPMRTIGSLSLGGSLLRLGLVDRLRVMLFPQILGETGQEPILEGLPDINLRLAMTRVLDGRIVLLEYQPESSR